jgi:lipopolysaccharide export system permease protein
MSCTNAFPDAYKISLSLSRYLAYISMLKTIDFYIIRKFLGTFFYAIALIILIVIIFDLSEKIDDFIEKKAPLHEIIFVYYANFIPYFINLFSPLFTFIAVIFFTSRLAFNTEIIAILSSGVSFKRLLVPYILSAIFLALFSVYLSNFLIPQANQKRLDFEYTYVKNPQSFRDRNIHIQIRPGIFIYMESYNARNNTGYRFALEEINEGRLTYKLMAEHAIWDSLEASWKIKHYHTRTINGLDESLHSGEELDTILPFTPNDFLQDLAEMEKMNFGELRNHIDNEKLKGSEYVKFFEVEKHRRMAFPFSTIVLTIIGVALSSKKVRGGIGLHLGVGLGLSFSFILFMQVSTTFATNGNLHPFMAVWIPNLLYGILGAYLLKAAPK